ncbi:MAG: YaiI/YqxD family protein [Lachnospiraceae bacterium]|nr:YaiI/YqxD family protein [Lachnospiraceae bacterium]
MRILVDADACPVINEIEEIAKIDHIPVILVCDTNHALESDYSEIRIIGEGTDAVDFALINMCGPDDIVVTQDFGVAAMALGKGARALRQNGQWYTDKNIDQMLTERHLKRKERNSKHKSRNHVKRMTKRTAKEDCNFVKSLTNFTEEGWA